MAYSMMTGDARLPMIYNVAAAVGHNAPNRWDDVVLVQYLLLNIYASGRYPSPGGKMTTDGICGPRTRAWIKAFQAEMIKQGWCMKADGRVDTAPARAEDHNVTYTIVMLNYELQRCDINAWTLLPHRVLVHEGSQSGAQIAA
jgi:hypothetical protein